MATAAQNVSQLPRPLGWFREFFKEELAPYPGRAALVARMVICATLVMILTMTFRIPYGSQGALFTLIISRENPRATMRAVRAIFITFAFSVVYILIGAMFSSGDPMLRMLWIIGSLFIIFYAISAMTDYVAATSFGILVAVTIPLWDQHIAAELKVENTLWAFLQTAMACGITLLVELVLRPEDDLSRSIADRLASVEKLLNSYNADSLVDEQTERKITSLAMVGTSRLRRILKHSSHSQHYREQMGAVVALVGRLVDLAANLTYLSIQLSDYDRKRMRKLAESLASIRADLLSGRVPRLIGLPGEDEPSHAVPLLREMEGTVLLIPEVFAGSQSLSVYAPPLSGDPPSRLFVQDALSNSEHIKFGLKRLPGSEPMLHRLHFSCLAGNQHCSRHMLVDRADHHRYIPSEAGLTSHRRYRGRCHFGNRGSGVYPASPRFDRRVYTPLHSSHRHGCLDHNIRPTPFIFRGPACPCVLCHQPAGIQNTDVTCGGKRPCCRHFARPLHDVACL
jgi:multidrug resistance protein MdtO